MARWNYASEAHRSAAQRPTQPPKLNRATEVRHNRFFLYVRSPRRALVWDLDPHGTALYGVRWIGPFLDAADAWRFVDRLLEIEAARAAREVPL